MSPDILQASVVCIVIAFAAASISMTLTQTELFAPLRQWANKIGHMTGHLFHCFYCISHWIVIFAVLIYQPILIRSGYIFIDLIVSVFFTITLTAFICGLIFKVFLTAIAKKFKENEFKKSLVE